jgi:hypothetical protein
MFLLRCEFCNNIRDVVRGILTVEEGTTSVVIGLAMVLLVTHLDVDTWFETLFDISYSLDLAQTLLLYMNEYVERFQVVVLINQRKVELVH